MAKALALFSGGLDSLLSIIVILKQDIKVTALRFLTPFNTKIFEHKEKKDYEYTIGNLRFEIKGYPIYEEFLEVLKKPKYGYGKNMNPCVDCKILMLKEAKRMMLEEGYDFIITGEVLFQRPMSQRRDILSVIDRDAKVQGYVIRPLSAKLLNPSIAEELGIIDREKLYNFSGRTRKPQMKLAKELGLKDYVQPAGGCLLTDPLYTAKLRDLFMYNPDPSIDDIMLLRVGRHFRVSSNLKIIVGRDERDNEFIKSIATPSDCILWVEGYGSPLTLIKGRATEKAIELAASLCARHSDAKKMPEIEVSYEISGNISKIKVSPAEDYMLTSFRV